MYSNFDVAKAFYQKKRLSNKNLTSTGNKLISFSTTIAERICVDADIVLIVKNVTKYSITTSKHQAYIHKYNCVTKDNVPKNTANLRKYINNDWI